MEFPGLVSAIHRDEVAAGAYDLVPFGPEGVAEAADLISSDIGRPLSDLTSQLAYRDLHHDARKERSTMPSLLAAVNVGDSVQTALDSFFGFLPKLIGVNVFTENGKGAKEAAAKLGESATRCQWLPSSETQNAARTVLQIARAYGATVTPHMSSSGTSGSSGRSSM